eukprot:m.172914 g.172914  ORF g.172914 m.172914 type:complete len:545 (+) comp13610_c0_seq1:313-1947(+)
MRDMAVDNNLASTSDNAHGWGKRHVVVLLGFIGFFNVYAMRVNLSVAALSMTEEYRWCGHNVTGGTNCETTGTVLGSFFYGYICTQILGGWLATRFGGKHVYGVGVLVTSVLTLLTPWAADAGVEVLVALRVLEGIGEGVTFPAFNQVLGQWVPSHDRTKFATFAYSGALFGTIVSNPVSGYLCSLPRDTVVGCTFCTGWRSVFYLFGTLGLLWYILWMMSIVSDPARDRSVTAAELLYIQGRVDTADLVDKNLMVTDGKVVTTTTGTVHVPVTVNGHANHKPMGSINTNRVTHPSYDDTTPLLHPDTTMEDPTTTPVQSNTDLLATIATSGAVWAIVVGNTVANWGFYNLLTCMPQYMKNVLGLDMNKLGFLSSLPYICAFVVAIGVGQVADAARANGVRTVIVRKVCQAVGLVVMGGGLLAVAYLDHLTTTTAMVLLCVAMSGNGVGNSGWLVNHLDIAPPYAGLLMGITNTFGTVPGFIAPLVTDMITTADPHTEPELLKEQWRTVFQINAALSAFGIMVFITFARGERQVWAGGIKKESS